MDDRAYYQLFLSTPSARRATSPSPTADFSSSNFYPRPPRGGRPIRSKMAAGEFGISIHALREEGDQCRPAYPCRPQYFYPRPPRGGRRWTMTRREFFQNFYPRPPRGGRPLPQKQLPALAGFLSTPSARRATFSDGTKMLTDSISIHALREEGDPSSV